MVPVWPFQTVLAEAVAGGPRLCPPCSPATPRPCPLGCHGRGRLGALLWREVAPGVVAARRAWWLWSPVPAWGPGPGAWPERRGDFGQLGGCGSRVGPRGAFAVSPAACVARPAQGSRACVPGLSAAPAARPPLCPAADAVREPWAGSVLPLATESFLAWGLRGSFPPRKPPSVTISLMTVTHSHCSEAFSPRRGAGRGSWVLGHSGSHGEAAGSRRATGRRGTWGTVSCWLLSGPVLPAAPRVPESVQTATSGGRAASALGPGLRLPLGRRQPRPCWPRGWGAQLEPPAAACVLVNFSAPVTRTSKRPSRLFLEGFGACVCGPYQTPQATSRRLSLGPRPAPDRDGCAQSPTAE